MISLIIVLLNFIWIIFMVIWTKIAKVRVSTVVGCGLVWVVLPSFVMWFGVNGNQFGLLVIVLGVFSILAGIRTVIKGYLAIALGHEDSRVKGSNVSGDNPEVDIDVDVDVGIDM
jgi:hypothetical protein